MTGQTCCIAPRSEIYLGTDLLHTLDMTNFDWTDLLHTTQIFEIYLGTDLFHILDKTNFDWTDLLHTTQM